jgi:hypothetical protein
MILIILFAQHCQMAQRDLCRTNVKLAKWVLYPIHMIDAYKYQGNIFAEQDMIYDLIER